jgi:hypothetical protein
VEQARKLVHKQRSLGVEDFNAAYYLQTLVALRYPQKLWLMQYRCDFVALPYWQKLWFYAV